MKYFDQSNMNRPSPHWTKLAAASLLAVAALAGCGGGSDGAAGPAGPAGSTGAPGAAGTPGKDLTNLVKIAALTPAQWADAKFTGTVTGVTISSPPVVTFKVTDAAGNPVVGLANTSKSATATVASYPNVAFTLAKLVPGANGDPSKWVSYNVTTVPTTTAPTVLPTRPTTDSNGTLVDNGDGSYKYTFYRDITKSKDVVAAAAAAATAASANNVVADLGDLTYDANLTHRVVLQISGNLRGTGSNTADGVTLTPGVAMKNPLNVAYDFIPATGKAVAATDAQRNVVDTAKCNECHGKLNALGFHGGSRNDIRICATCHTDQRKYGQARVSSTLGAFPALTKVVSATGSVSAAQRTYVADGEVQGNLPVFIHKLHGGSVLKKTNYNYANVFYNDIGYPQDIRNCSKCHDGSATSTAKTSQGDNWKNVPSILACGSCHDGINFATGAGTTIAGATTGHIGGAKANNAQCVLCHDAASVTTYHLTDYATPNNPAVPAGLKNFKYEVKSAAATATAVTVVFKITMDGTPVTFLAPAAAMANPLTGFRGGPSFLLAYAKSQDGITTPVDYNNIGNGVANAQPVGVSIANLLDTAKAATSGTLAGPDASGYYTATIVGTNVFPAGASMRTVALQGYFTQIAPASGRHTLSVVKTVTGDTVRRSVVDSAKCGACHEVFEGHGGNRNIGLASEQGIVVCVVCHNPGIVASGRGISDAALNAYAFSVKDLSVLGSWGFDKTLLNAALALPQVTNDFKDMIHGIHAGKDRTNPIRIARDRTPAAITLIDGKLLAFPGVLSACETCHKAGSYSSVPANTLASTQEADNGVFLNGLSRATADAKAALKQPNALDKMITPFTAACVSCHDAATAKAHMSLNGGQILVSRSAMNIAGESCAVCHAAGKEFDPAVVHK